MKKMQTLTCKEFTFSKPTTALRELLILSAIEENLSISQTVLADRAGIVSSMANNYIKDLVRRGLVSMEGETNRDKTYALTDEGRAFKQQLAMWYSIESIRSYQEIRGRFAARLRELADEGFRRIVLYGAAETGEIVLAAARRSPVEIVGVVDGDETKHRASFGGLTVFPPSEILVFRPDAVLITSFAHRHEIHEAIRHMPSHGIAVRHL